MEIISRQELWKRGIVQDVHQQSCVFYFREIETASHVFARCPKTRVIQGAYL
jgi:hypothetical protein